MSEAYVMSEGTRLYYNVDGPADASPLVLLNSIGTSCRIWEDLRSCISGKFRTVCIDARGHGRSQASYRDYSLELLAHDVAAVMDDAEIFSSALAGVSLGGMVAMEFALQHPQRCTSLIPICTSAHMDAGAWQDRIDIVRGSGLEPIAGMSMERFFSEDYRRDSSESVDEILQSLLTMNPAGYAGCAAAIRDMSLASRLANIAAPTLVVSGEKDISTPYTGHAEHLVSAIPGARHLSLDCGHLAPMEKPAELAAAISDFVQKEIA